MGDFSRRIRANQYAAPLALIAALLLILFATLKPFRIRFSHLSLSDYLSGFVLGPSAPFDFTRNILLFVPLGFFLGAILDRRGWPKNRIRLVVFFSGLLLTITVESLQQFLPGRQPSVADLIANTLGAIVGLACFRLWQKRHTAAEWLRGAMIEPPKVLAALAFYMLLLLVMANALASSARLYSWDMRYHLMLGNEWTGDRPWIGSVRDLVIFNEALDVDDARRVLMSPELAAMNGESLQAYYSLAGGSPYPDLTAKQPSLIWQEGNEIKSDGDRVQFDGGNWLATGFPAGHLFEELVETSQFSIHLSATTAELKQFGPARLLSISEDPYFRNLMFGQEGDDLVIRFRSPLTGDNGGSPQFQFPDFFTDSAPINFAVIYDGLAVNLVDARSSTLRTIEVVPGVTFYSKLQDLVTIRESPSSQIPSGQIYNWFYRLLFYTAVLLPVGILLALRSVSTWPKNSRLILMVCSLLVVPFLLELVLVAGSGQGVRPLNIVTSMAVVAVTTLIAAPVVRRLPNFLRKAGSR